MKSTILLFVTISSIATCICYPQVHDQFWKNQKYESNRGYIARAQFRGYRNNCVPQGEGCLCIIGTEASTGLHVEQVHTSDAACKCRHDEVGDDCTPTPARS
uniref:Uncharacterized protein n=1 Tax=Plectus sambesii TaxID=2011161 RepID=A0A914UMD4_9BILA